MAKRLVMNIAEIEEKMESLSEEVQASIVERMESIQAKLNIPLDPSDIAREFDLPLVAYLTLSDSAREEVKESYRFGLAKRLAEDFRDHIVSESKALINKEEASLFCNKGLGLKIL
jgi:chorismate mutase